jgi:hypothetical protein
MAVTMKKAVFWDVAPCRCGVNLPGLELRPSVVQPVGSRYTDCAIPAPSFLFGMLFNYAFSIEAT